MPSGPGCTRLTATRAGSRSAPCTWSENRRTTSGAEPAARHTSSPSLAVISTSLVPNRVAIASATYLVAGSPSTNALGRPYPGKLGPGVAGGREVEIDHGGQRDAMLGRRPAQRTATFNLLRRHRSPGRGGFGQQLRISAGEVRIVRGVVFQKIPPLLRVLLPILPRSRPPHGNPCCRSSAMDGPLNRPTWQRTGALSVKSLRVG